MSQQVTTKTILNFTYVDADEEGEWFDVSDCDKVIFEVDVADACPVKLQLDTAGDEGNIIELGSYTANAEKVMDDPVGYVRAITSGAGASDTAVVKMHMIYMKE